MVIVSSQLLYFLSALLFIGLQNVLSFPMTVLLWFIYLLGRFFLKVNKEQAVFDELTILFISLYSLFNVFPASGSFTYFDIHYCDVISSLKRTFYVIIGLTICIDMTKLIRRKAEREFNAKVLRMQDSHTKFDIKMWVLRIIIVGLIFYTLFIILRIGPSTFLSNVRLYGKSIIFIGNSYAQIVLIPVSIFLLFPRSREAKTKRMARFDKMIVLVFWILYILAGARKEIFILLMCVVGVGVFSFKRNLKWIIPLGLSFMALAFIREGVIKLDRIMIVFNEYMMPQYTQFISEYSLNEFQHNSILSYSGLSNGYNALVPSFLRLSEFKSFGESFMELPFVPLGIGAHPLGEAYLNFGYLGYIIFVLTFTLFYNLIFRISIKFPEVLIISMGYLTVVGRSDLWLTIFYILYSSIILIVLARKIIIGRKEMSSIYV